MDVLRSVSVLAGERGVTKVEGGCNELARRVFGCVGSNENWVSELFLDLVITDG